MKTVTIKLAISVATRILNHTWQTWLRQKCTTKIISVRTMIGLANFFSAIVLGIYDLQEEDAQLKAEKYALQMEIRRRVVQEQKLESKIEYLNTIKKDQKEAFSIKNI